ncbi:MAG: CHAD domain-containing protein [Verrucomicrobia subdivision 3 bacterium]|nr:CHAD domain-containing protein [Limisphaerales bacterium]
MKNWEHALAAALKGRWGRYRAMLKRCQRGFSEGSIHASRIEARRLSAQLDLLHVFASRRAIEKAQRTIKRHLNIFDPLRDAQVQLAMLEQECKGTPGAGRIRKLTAKRERRCRREAKERIRDVKTRRVRSVVQLIAKRLQEGARDSERMRLDRTKIIHGVDMAFARVVQCRQRMDAADTATIHRTRVAFKRFRYMMESMRLICPEIRRRQLDTMHAFQGVLGDLQDTDVFLARLDKLIQKRRIKIAEVAPLRRWLLRRHVRQVNRCLRRADVVFKFWPLKSAGQTTE